VLIFAIVGALDDSVKIWNHRDDGLNFLPKLTAEIVAALLAILVLAAGRFYFVLSLPFGFSIHSVIVFALFLIIWLVGWSNATNLTDGLDGLASGVAIIAYTAYLILAWQQGNEAVMLFDALMIGALLGFLVFNHYPATIFMGDTGSLALGAGLAMSAVVLHLEWSLVLIGFVFMVETLTVMIQVTVYHFFKKRVFLIAPLHHSFEKGGLFGDKPWSEWHVDLFFWGLGLISAGLYFWLFN
jgi:phospho-N-acetylmuramoyl-pentapeptide-transferase